MGVKLPISPFVAKVLRHVGIAPTQLQPNGWAYLRSFEVLCEYFHFVPSHKIFLFFFKVSRDEPTLDGYASLCGRNLFQRFEPFASHFKN